MGHQELKAGSETTLLCWADHAKFSAVHAVKYDPKTSRWEESFGLRRSAHAVKCLTFSSFAGLEERRLFWPELGSALELSSIQVYCQGDQDRACLADLDLLSMLRISDPMSSHV